ncbi:MAG: YceI family protein, partial [Rhizomicrobium sp.]
MKAAARLVFAVAILAAPTAQAAHWNVDAAKSKLAFSVLWAKQPFTATFQNWKADIDFDPAHLAASKADVIIAVGSMTSGDPDTDGSLKGDIGLGTDKFPTARFTTTGFTHKSGNNYVAQGNLTLKGITRPLTLPF